MPVAGCMRNDGAAGMPDLWSVYLATDDVQKHRRGGGAHGGQVIVPAMQVMALGTMASSPTRVAPRSAVGSRASTRDSASSTSRARRTGSSCTPATTTPPCAFYEDVFEWDAHVMSDTPEFRYTTLGEGDDALAGIMDATGFLPEGVPSHWSVYFAVDDTDAALARIAELGGRRSRPAEDTPYGRLASARRSHRRAPSNSAALADS